MKKFLIALNIVIWSFVGYQQVAHAAPAKKPVATKKAPAKKAVAKKPAVKKVPPTTSIRPEIVAPPKVQRKAVLSKGKKK